MRNIPKHIASRITVMAVLAGGQFFAAPPDLTQSNTVDRAATYNIGAAGLRGWIYTRAISNLDASQGCTTTTQPELRSIKGEK